MRYLLDRHIRHLLALAEHGTVQGAASALAITQPALSKSLQRLEQEFGAKLFERTPNGLHATEAGERLISHARILADTSRQAELELSLLVGSGGGTLRLGAGLAWSISRIPKAISEISRQFPRLSIELTVGVGPQLLPLLATRKIDVFVGGLHQDLIPEGCSIEHRVDLELQTFARRDHPLVGTPDRSRLAAYPWGVFLGDVAGRELVGAFLKEMGSPPPAFTLVSDSVISMLEAARHSDHLLPLIEVLSDEARARGLTRVPDLPPITEISSGIVLRQGLEPLKPLKLLLDILRDG